MKEHVYNIRKHRCIDLTVSIDSNKNHWCNLPVHVSSLRLFFRHCIFQTLRTGDNSDDSTHKVAQHVPRWRIRMSSRWWKPDFIWNAWQLTIVDAMFGWLIDWFIDCCLTPTLAVFQLYHGVRVWRVPCLHIIHLLCRFRNE